MAKLRVKSQTPAERRKSARKAGKARWDAWRAEVKKREGK